MYISNYSEFEDMVSYSKYNKKYFTGKQIKDIVQKCLDDETVIGGRRKELNAFTEKYINSKYPLNDNGLYCIFWIGKNYDELKCCKSKVMLSA